MSLQPLPPTLQDILNRAIRTQYVVSPASTTIFDTVEEIDDAIISQFFQQASVPILTPNIFANPIPQNQTQQETQQPQQETQQQQQTQQSQQQPRKLTRAEALGLRLNLGFLATLLLILGLAAAISGDYLDNILSSVKEILRKE